jgi:hypothetical protein
LRGIQPCGTLWLSPIEAGRKLALPPAVGQGVGAQGFARGVAPTCDHRCARERGSARPCRTGGSPSRSAFECPCAVARRQAPSQAIPAPSPGDAGSLSRDARAGTRDRRTGARDSRTGASKVSLAGIAKSLGAPRNLQAFDEIPARGFRGIRSGTPSKLQRAGSQPEGCSGKPDGSSGEAIKVARHQRSGAPAGRTWALCQPHVDLEASGTIGCAGRT